MPHFKSATQRLAAARRAWSCAWLAPTLVVTVTLAVGLAATLTLGGCKCKPEPIEEEEELAVEEHDPSSAWRARFVEWAERQEPPTDGASADSGGAAGSWSGSGGGASGSVSASGRASGGGTQSANPLADLITTGGGASTNASSDAAGAGDTIADAPHASNETSTPHDADVDAEPPQAPGDGQRPTRTQWSELLESSDEFVDALLPAPPPEIEASLSALDRLALPDGDRRRDYVGIWVQTAGSMEPDFFSGGHRQSVLVFRSDGMVDVIRTFDADGTVRTARRFDYAVEADGRVVLGGDARRRPTIDRRERRVPLPDGGTATIRPPVRDLPVGLEGTIDDDRLRLDGRTYRRVDRRAGGTTGSPTGSTTGS